MADHRTPRGAGLAFIEQAVAYEGDDCLIWPYGGSGHKVPYGRVRVTIDGKSVHRSAHRLVLERTQGPPPEPGMIAAHAPVICHTPTCVNPRHLRWATYRENSHDRRADGTMAALSRDDVEFIRLYESRVKRSAMAIMFGVSESLIRSIQLGESYDHVTINGQVTVPGQRWKLDDESSGRQREWYGQANSPKRL